MTTNTDHFGNAIEAAMRPKRAHENPATGEKPAAEPRRSRGWPRWTTDLLWLTSTITGTLLILTLHA